MRNLKYLQPEEEFTQEDQSLVLICFSNLDCQVYKLKTKKRGDEKMDNSSK